MDEKVLYDGKNDKQFARPYIDEDEWREIPVRHHYIHGGFEGTYTKFCFYFPQKENYKGRFIQPLMPTQGDEKEAQYQEGVEDKISFAINHGFYLVESNLGGVLNGGGDSSLLYRCCAACAQFSRKLAAEYYGKHRPFGYVYGGSGGGFKTISCVESTTGIWDGAVPFVIGSFMSLPNVFTARSHAMRILRDKMEMVKDAIEPGGSGDPYACLNEEEKAALREVELMGFPMKTWCVYDTIGEGALPVLIPGVMAIDPTYCRDFWELPGYMGTEENGSALRDRIVMESEVVEVLHPQLGVMGIADSIDEKNAYGVDEAWKHIMAHGQKLPVFVLRIYPKGDFYRTGMKIRFLSGGLAGEQFGVVCLPENSIAIDVGMDQRNLGALLEKVQPGDRVVLDNSDYIALQTFHRHQMPGPEFHAWDQFRDRNGNPIYPQRDVLVGPAMAMGGAGSIQEGNPNCKIIVLESLMDESAFPWQADWYCNLVRKNKGDDADSQMRLWYMENCMHTDCEEGNGGDHQHIVSYLGALYQALLDISDWVERGIEPVKSSGYDMEGTQVLIKKTAKERNGVQSVVSMAMDGQQRKEIPAGNAVKFEAEVQLPTGSGDVELILWDFEESNEFLPGGTIVGRQEDRVYIENTHIFTKPGIHFPVVKVATNRTFGDEFTRIFNQARVRVVVKEQAKV